MGDIHKQPFIYMASYYPYGLDHEIINMERPYLGRGILLNITIYGGLL